MINNFEKIRNLLTFPTEHSFYFVEVIKRRKENPDMERHSETIKDFYVTSLKSFDSQFNKIKGYCDRFNARGYFRLNARDARMIALQCNKRLAELLITEDWKALKSMYPSVVGEFHSDPVKKWLIDIDIEEGEDSGSLVKRLVAIEEKIKEIGGEDRIVERFETPNGVHIISKPFRLDVFQKAFPTMKLGETIHKDNPTILYHP